MAINIEQEVKRLNARIAKLTEYARELDANAFDHNEGGETVVAVPKELFEAFMDQFDLYD